METKVAEPRPKPGSVESYEEMMRRAAHDDMSLWPFAVGVIESIIEGLHASDAEKVEHVRNVLIARERAWIKPSAPPAVSAAGADGPQEPAEDATITPLPGSHVVHLGTTHDAKTSCGLLLADLDDSFRWTFDHGDVTCTACIDGVPF